MCKSGLPTPRSNAPLSNVRPYTRVRSVVCVVGLMLAGAVPCLSAPIIDNNPSNVSACEENAAAFTVVAHSSIGGTLTYQWRKGTTNLTDGGNVSGATSLTLIISPVGSGDAASNYNVVVTEVADGSVTSTNASLTVYLLPAAPTGVGASPPAVCAGHSTSLSATVGAGETVDWYADACDRFSNSLSIGSGSPLSVTPAATTTYYARARNTSTGCESSSCVPVTVTVNSNPTVAISPNPAAICAGLSLQLHGNPAGGSGSYSTHAWTGDTAPLSSTTVENPTFTSSAPATYHLTYTVMDSNGCVGSEAIDVVVNALPDPPTVVVASPSEICDTFSSTLSATVGAGGDTLEWFSDSCGGTLISGQSPTVSPSSTITYYVRSKTTATGCVSACVPVTLTVNPLPHTPTIDPAPAICDGESTTLTAHVDGSTGAETVDWYTVSCGGTPAGNGLTLLVNPSVTTTYYARARNTSETTQCVSAACATVTLVVNPLPHTPTIDPVAAICNGQSTTLTAHVDNSTGAETVDWYTGSCGGTPAGNGLTLLVNPSVTTTYYALARNTSETTQCISATCASVTLVVNPLPNTPTVDPASDICNGQSATLTAHVDNSTGTETVDWYSEPGTGSTSCGTTPESTGTLTLNVSPTVTTTYYARARNTSETTQCVSTACASVTLVVNPLPAIPTGVLASPDTICNGHSSTLSATVGAGGDVLEWFTDSCGGTPIAGQSPTVSPTSTTTYYVRSKVTSTGCVSDCVPVTVTVNGNPAASPSGGSVCSDGSLGVHGNPSGGSGSYTGHLWGGPGAVYLSLTSAQDPTFHYTGPPIVQPAPAQVFNLTYQVTDSNGCIGSGVTSVTVNPLPDCTITAPSQVSANSTGNGASVQSAGVGAAYAWTVTGGNITSGQGTSAIVFTAGPGPGNVQIAVTVTTAALCTCTNTGISVPIHSGPATLELGFDHDCYKPGDTVTATLSMSGVVTPAAGFQAFLAYDPTYLTFTGWTYTTTPFGLHVLNTLAMVRPTIGELNVAGGIDQVNGQAPSTSGALLVTLTFQVASSAPDDCTASGLLTFRSHVPPTRLTDAFANELLPLTLTPPQTVVIDSTPPDLSQSLASINSCYPDAAAAEADALAAVVPFMSDNCTPNGQLIVTHSTVGTCSAVVTVTVKDCAGNISSKSYNTIIDNDVPVIHCPLDLNLQCASEVPAHATDLTSFVSQGGSASDVCSVSVVWVSDVETPAVHCPNHYTITRTYRASDPCGHTMDCVQTIAVDDTTPPTLTAPPDLPSLQCASDVPPHDFAGGSANDNCGPPTVTWEGDVTTPLGCPNHFQIVRTYKATDACGLATTATQTITVNDTTDPVLTIPNDITIECDQSIVPGLPFGSLTGGIAIYYNSTGGEVPTNQAYLKSQYSATNAHGAAFTFSSVPLTGSGLTWAALFGQAGSPPQFGFDLVLQTPYSNGSVPTPVLNAYDNFDNSLAYRTLVGPVTWAINDYKDGAPNGPQNPANDIVNSIVRSISPGAPVTDVVITRNALSHPSANIYTVDLAGKLHSDSLIHWFNPSTPDTPMSVFSLNGDFYFSGTLTYDTTTDTDPLMDFYAGTITISANSPNTAIGFATATDNCDPFPVVTYTDVITPGSCPNAETIVRTWKATDSCGNDVTHDQTITVRDTTPPIITCPSNLTFQCASSVPAHATDAASFMTQGGHVSDNCDPSPTVTWVSDDIVPVSHCPNRYTITRTYKATDACHNEATCIQTIVVNDDTVPIIHCPANVTVQCASLVPAPAADASAFIGQGGTVSDNCDPAPAVTWEGDAISGLTCINRYTITRTYKATDSCGNFDTCTQTITVNDTTPPQFTVSCPLPTISKNADAGQCHASAASVNAVAPPATDNCGTPAVVGTRSDSQPLSANYPLGDTVITWTATDSCGNSVTCQQTVHVSSVNEIIVSIELSPTVATPLDRCITFQVWDCGMITPAYTTTQVLTFTAGQAQNVSLLVPCGTYTCITARDKLHTLRRTLGAPDFQISGTQYVADFIHATGGSKQLIGGNLNDDGVIDILDFGVYAGQYGHSYGSGNNTCSTPFPNADMSGNGSVFTEDFTFLQINFLKVRDANCCGNANIASRDGVKPVTTITVAELKARGLSSSVLADLSGDGVVDQKDIAAWMQGARPGQPLPTAPPKRTR